MDHGAFYNVQPWSVAEYLHVLVTQAQAKTCRWPALSSKVPTLIIRNLRGMPCRSVYSEEGTQRAGHAFPTLDTYLAKKRGDTALSEMHLFTVPQEASQEHAAAG